ncbi:hypothetical protein, partial [Enterocloster clostridioformis]|uniref:hypothetical protein n=1 Tax=Enterocloster clostridioformis TaxID=1531 RepID=UPI001A9884D8
MNKSITQDNQNDNQISKSIRRFFTRFRVCQVKCVSFSKNISERDLRGKTAQSKSYMWLYGSGNDGLPPIRLYDYQPSR